MLSRVGLRHAVSVMPALLPKGGEFRMNSEGLGVFFSTYLLFSVPFLRVGGELRRVGTAPSVAALEATSDLIEVGLQRLVLRTLLR